MNVGRIKPLRQQNVMTTTPYWVTELVSANALALSPAERVLVRWDPSLLSVTIKRRKKNFVTLIPDPENCQLFE